MSVLSEKLAPLNRWIFWGKINLSCEQVDSINLSCERNSHIIKEMKVEGKILEKGDWIVVLGKNWEEDGMVVDYDDEEINMFDGKEGWTVKRSEIKKIYFK